MKINYRIALTFSLLCLILFISPCIYLLPAADDYCGMIELKERGGFWGNIVQGYLNWGGGYTGIVFQYFSPLNFNYSYSLIPVISIVIGLFCVNYLINTLLEIRHSFVFATCLVVLCATMSTEIYEMFYWFNGAAAYTIGTWLSMLLFAFALKAAVSKNSIFVLLCSIVMLFLGGLNSVAVIALPLFLLTTYLSSEEKNKTLLYFGILSSIIFCVVMFAPGNFNRATNFTNNYNVFHSLGMSVLQTLRFTFIWSLNPAFILSIFACYYLGNKKMIQLKYALNYKLLIGILLLLMFYAAFMPYMGTGILGQHRTYNATLPWFILIAHIIAVQLGARNTKLFETSPTNQKITLVLAFISILILGNGKNILKDHFQNNFKENYLIEMKQLEQVKQSNDYKLSNISENKIILNTYKGYKLIPGNEHWINECTFRYFKEVE